MELPLWAWAALAVVAALLVYVRWVEPRWLDVHEVDVPLAGLGRELDGYRITVLADLHWGARITHADLADVVEIANKQRADLIVIVGDITHYRTPIAHEGIEILDDLAAPDGVWCVLGNHDHRPGRASHVREVIAESSIRELQNESVVIHRGGSSFLLGGVGDPWRDACDVYGAFAGQQPELPRVLLAHNPDSLMDSPHVRVDLMISGHTHGGQVRLPWVGPLITRTRSGRALAAGLNRFSRSLVYTSRGIGLVYTSRGIGHGTYPIRFLCRPEAPVLVLRSVAAGGERG